MDDRRLSGRLPKPLPTPTPICWLCSIKSDDRYAHGSVEPSKKVIIKPYIERHTWKPCSSCTRLRNMHILGSVYRNFRGVGLWQPCSWPSKAYLAQRYGVLRLSRYLRKNKQQQTLYERADSVAEWQDLLHITRDSLQKPRIYMYYTLCECVETLKRAAESCRDLCFPGVVSDSSILEFPPAHTCLLHLCIHYSQHSRLRQACHMATVFETKTKSVSYHDLL